MSSSSYADVTNQIIAQLEKGVAPWRQPWTGRKNQLPRNVAADRTYNGVNVWLLWLASESNGWTSGLWGSYKQWLQLGGCVKRGERGVRICYWNVLGGTADDADAVERRPGKRFFLRHYTVFALEQCSGETLDHLRVPPPAAAFTDFEPTEDIIAATEADIRFGGIQAVYLPIQDRVEIPPKDCFEDQNAYYSTLFHELTHWTGHESRLNRLDKLARFGNHAYAMEELVAEMGAAFLTATLGISNVSAAMNSASYLDHWIRVMRQDSKAIFAASTAASKASDYILGFGRPTKVSHAKADNAVIAGN